MTTKQIGAYTLAITAFGVFLGGASVLVSHGASLAQIRTNARDIAAETRRASQTETEIKQTICALDTKVNDVDTRLNSTVATLIHLDNQTEYNSDQIKGINRRHEKEDSHE